MSDATNPTIPPSAQGVEEVVTSHSAMTRTIRQYKAAVKELIATDCPVERRLMRNQVFEQYRESLNFSRQDIDADILALSVPPPMESKTSYTLEELLTLDATHTPILVPKLLTSVGLYMLAAAPKSFKSYLMYDLCYAIATGTEFLKRFPVKQGRVVYYQCEEPISTVTARLLEMGFSRNRSNYHLVKDNVRVEREFDIQYGLGKLQTLINEFKPDLIIFDTLRRISATVAVSENSADFSKYLYALQRLMIQNETCGLVLHHTNKSQNATGLNKISGSGSIPGGTDGAIVIENKSTANETLIKLETIPRALLPIRFTIGIDINPRSRQKRFAYRWRDRGNEVSLDECTRLDTYEDLIVETLAQEPDVYISRLELTRRTGLPLEDNDVDMVLDELVGMRILHRAVEEDETQYARYCLPSNSPYLEEVVEPIPATEQQTTAQEPEALQVLMSECERIHRERDFAAYLTLTDRFPDEDLRNAVEGLFNTELRLFMARYKALKLDLEAFAETECAEASNSADEITEKYLETTNFVVTDSSRAAMEALVRSVISSAGHLLVPPRTSG